MINNLGIEFLWFYVGSFGLLITLLIIHLVEKNEKKRPDVALKYFCVCVVVLITSLAFLSVGIHNASERYNIELQTIQKNINMTGDIATQIETSCERMINSQNRCNSDMLDWYLEKHYNSDSNESMRVAMKMMIKP